MGMKRSAIISVVLLGAAAWAQSPQIIPATRAKLQAAQKTWNAQQGGVQAPAAQPPAAAKTANSPMAPKAATAGNKKTSDVPDARKLLPTAAAGTAAGEEQLTAAAKRDFAKRDPFLSPVVSRLGGPGSGCSGGKRCLAADSISLRGIVKS